MPLGVDRKNITSIEFEFNNSKGLNLSNKFDTIIHCAAVLPSSGKSEQEQLDLNVLATEKLLSHCTKFSPVNFIFLSSMSVYGEVFSTVIDEETNPNPETGYGKAKLICEEMIAKHAQSNDYAAWNLRLPGVVGLGSHHNFLSDLLKQVKEKKRATVFNSLGLFNNAIDIGSLLKFIDLLSQNTKKIQEKMPLGASNPITISELVSTIFKLLKQEENVIYRQGISGPIISSEKATEFGFDSPDVTKVIEELVKNC